MSAPWRESSVRECRICGCTDTRACIGKDGLPCHWIDDDLCSACDDRLLDPVMEEVAS